MKMQIPLNIRQPAYNNHTVVSNIDLYPFDSPTAHHQNLLGHLIDPINQLILW